MLRRLWRTPWALEAALMLGAMAGFLWAPMPVSWCATAAGAALGGAAALPALSRRPQLYAGAVHAIFAAASVCAFGAGAQRQPTLWTMALALSVLSLAGLLQPPAQRMCHAAACGLVGLVLGIVGHTLWRSGYAPQATRLWALMQGLAVGVALWQLRPRGGPSARSRKAANGVCAAVLVAAGRAYMAPAHAVGSMLPAWRDTALALSAPGADDHEAQDLLGLHIIGAQDAAFARVARALERNAAPQTLRPMCPKSGRRDVLSEAWGELVGRGQLICRALGSMMPEAGIVVLSAVGNDAGLCRLASDLAWEAGDAPEAQSWAKRATHLGDGYAAQNSRFARGLRGRSELAIKSASDVAGAAIWARYNSLMHFDDAAVDSHHGLQIVDMPAQLTSLYDPQRRAQVLAMHSVYGLGAGLELPLPQGAPMPAALRLLVRPRGGLQVRLRDTQNAVQTFDCAHSEASVAHHDEAQAHRPLPPAACSGGWADVILPLRPGAKGVSLLELRLYGEFMLAAIEVIAARPPPCDQAADTGHDLRPDTQEEPCVP